MRRLRKPSTTTTVTGAGVAATTAEESTANTTSALHASSTKIAAISRRKVAMEPATLNYEVWRNFEKAGRTEFMKYLKQQLKDGYSPIFGKADDFKSGISSAIYDLLWHGLRCTLKKDTVLGTLSDIVSLHADFPSVILDIVNIIDAETSLMTDGIQEERLMFCQIIKDLDKVIPDTLIKERLEIDTLQDVGIVKNKVFYTKFIKIKTKL